MILLETKVTGTKGSKDDSGSCLTLSGGHGTESSIHSHPLLTGAGIPSSTTL